MGAAASQNHLTTVYRAFGILSVAVVTSDAFQSGVPPLLRPKHSSDGNIVANAVTDPITLLESGNNNFFYASTTIDQSTDQLLADEDLSLSPASIARLENRSREPTTRSKSASSQQTMNSPTDEIHTVDDEIPKRKKRSSRSSTMPGYTFDRSKMLAAELKRIEDLSGRDLKKEFKSKAARERRKSKSGEALYQSSSSVPDSLMMFAKELHQVSSANVPNVGGLWKRRS